MAATKLNVLSLDTSASNVGTTTAVQLSAATPIPTSKIVMVNNTASIIALCTGVAGSEVALVAVLPASQLNLDLSLNVLPVGVRLSLLAIDTAASTKFVTVSLLP